MSTHSQFSAVKKWFPAQTKHGYAPSHINGQMHSVEGYPGTLPTLAKCELECERRNKHQIEDARAALLATQERMADVAKVFNLLDIKHL